MKKLFGYGLLVLFLFGGTELFATEARDILLTINKRNDTILSELNKSKLTTCKYFIKKRKYGCSDKPRVKIYQGISKYYSKTTETGKRDQKGTAIILSPSSEYGIANLSFSYKENDKDDEAWVYFSALGKVRRIVSSKKDQDEPSNSSFFGSEFNMEDVENKSLIDYDYKIIKSEKYLKRDCWLIEGVPTPQRARKSHYSKFRIWVDKKNLITLKLLTYNRKGTPYKEFTYSKWKKFGDLWRSNRTIVKNLLTERMSILSTLEVSYNIAIPDEFLTQRTLTDRVFREKHIEKLRKRIKN